MTDFLTEMNSGPLVVPQRIERTGIRRGLLEDLALKVLYLGGEMTLIELGNHLCLSLAVVEEIFQFFRKERLCEVKGMTGGTHRIATSAEGRQRAADLLSLNQYTGPAPVSLSDYITRIKHQSVQSSGVRPEQLEFAFQQLVLTDDMLLRVGTAGVSGTWMVPLGPPGTGNDRHAQRHHRDL